VPGDAILENLKSLPSVKLSSLWRGGFLKIRIKTEF
jgi:hypothetical protein